MGVASFHSPPTHCRKTKGGAGVRTRILTGISQVAFAYAKALDRYAPLCSKAPRVVRGSK